MSENTNYLPKRENTGIQIPEFLKSESKFIISEDELDNDIVQETVDGINEALKQAEENKIINERHIKELDKIADAYSEEEAKVVVKRLVSNYPDIVLGEVSQLILDMQELSSSILRNSKIFASKRGEN